MVVQLFDNGQQLFLCLGLSLALLFFVLKNWLPAYGSDSAIVFNFELSIHQIFALGLVFEYLNIGRI